MAHVEQADASVSEGDEISPADLLAGIVRSFVNDAKQVQVENLPGPEGSLLTLRVASDDLQIVLGQNGRTARCLRTIVEALGKRTAERLTLDIQPRS